MAEVQQRRTARLLLRRPRSDDVPAIAELHADPLNYPHSPDGAHSPERAQAMAERAVADWDRQGIGWWVAERDGELIGVLGVTPWTGPSPPMGRPCWNLYYRFVPAARGQGLAAEATHEAVAVAAELDPVRPVIVRTRPANGPARRLAEALGLQRRADLDADDGFVVYVSFW